MRPIVTRYLAVALILCVPATLVAAPKPPKKLDTSEKSAQTFRYKHKAGEKLLYTNGVIQEMELEVMGGDLPIPNTATRTSMIAKITQETTKVLPSGEAEVQTIYDDLEIEISQGPKMVDKAQLAPMVDQLKKIKSVSRLTAQGEQKGFEVQGAPGAQNMNESLRSALIGAQPKFPEKGIKIGQGWSQDIPLKMAQGPIKMEMNFKVTYTFLGYTQRKAATAKTKAVRLAVFKMNVDLQIKGEPGSAMSGQSIKLDGKGSGLGYLYFDQAAGSVHASDAEISQVITMEVSVQEQSQKMRMTMKTEATMNRRR